MMAKSNDPLLRSAAGVLLGYVVLASVSVLGILAIRSFLGIDRLYEPGRFVPTALFMALQIGLALVAAAVAGFLCRRVAAARGAVFAFAAIVFVLSFVQALFAATMPNGMPAPRTGSETAEAFQAEAAAQQPIWLTLALPIVLVAGILLGSWRRGFKTNT